MNPHLTLTLSPPIGWERRGKSHWLAWVGGWWRGQSSFGLFSEAAVADRRYRFFDDVLLQGQDFALLVEFERDGGGADGHDHRAGGKPVVGLDAPAADDGGGVALGIENGLQM
jgi:hypothetical protein